MRLFILFFVTALAATTFTTPAQADQVRLIAGGWSYHLTDAKIRAGLNQTQNTLGVEYVRGPWNVQASHITDSFGCSAWQIVGGRQFQLTEWGWGSFGAAVDGIITYRCSRKGITGVEKWTTSGPPRTANELDNILHSHFPGSRPDFYSWHTQHTGEPHQQTLWRAGFYKLGGGPHQLVIGVIPGLYLNLGNRVRIETGLIYSTWSHRFVLYGQISLLLYQFGG